MVGRRHVPEKRAANIVRAGRRRRCLPPSRLAWRPTDRRIPPPWEPTCVGRITLRLLFPHVPMRSLPLALSLFALTLLSGCDLVGDILEFGFWAGAIIVLVVVALVWFAARAFRR